MEDIEILSKKNIKPKKEEIKKAKFEDKLEKKLNNTNHNININKEYPIIKTEILCSYFFWLINIIQIYSFNRSEKKKNIN